MRRRTRVEITIETSLMVVRRGANQTNAWCARCASWVQSVTPEEPAVPPSTSQRAVVRWLRCGLLRLGESAISSRAIELHPFTDDEVHEGASALDADRCKPPPDR